VTVNRTDLNRVMMGQASFDDLIKEGTAKFEGDRSRVRSAAVHHRRVTPDFEILPGTAEAEADAPKPFEVRDLVNR